MCILVENTNKRGPFHEMGPRNARVLEWKDTLVEELYTYLGILIYMGFIERRRLLETSCRKLELIDCYKSAKLPVYVPKKKVEAQPLIRSLHSAL
jgi:hypothetical protein